MTPLQSAESCACDPAQALLAPFLLLRPQAVETAGSLFTAKGQEQQRRHAFMTAQASLLAAQHASSQFDRAADSCGSVLALLEHEDRRRPGVLGQEQRDAQAAAALKQAGLLRITMVTSALAAAWVQPCPVHDAHLAEQEDHPCMLPPFASCPDELHAGLTQLVLGERRCRQPPGCSANTLQGWQQALLLGSLSRRCTWSAAALRDDAWDRQQAHRL